MSLSPSIHYNVMIILINHSPLFVNKSHQVFVIGQYGKQFQRTHLKPLNNWLNSLCFKSIGKTYIWIKCSISANHFVAEISIIFHLPVYHLQHTSNSIVLLSTVNICSMSYCKNLQVQKIQKSPLPYLVVGEAFHEFTHGCRGHPHVFSFYHQRHGQYLHREWRV